MRGATVFLNVTQSDRATATDLDRQVSLGVQYKGAIPARPADTLGLALAANHVSARVAANERLLDGIPGNRLPVQGSEYVTEVFYGWKPWPYLTLRPNFQYILHPDGTTAYANVVVIGLKTTLDF
jgi:porin